MTRKIQKNKEGGVALLFALGLLSLMSVLGVAFVANSLTAQKTATNINMRNQAKILLDSAVNRIMISVMAVLYQRQSADDLRNIYSSSNGYVRGGDSSNPEGHKDSDGNIIPKYDNTQDLLNDPSSGMRLVVPGHSVFQMSKSPASWVYVRDAENKVIGRMAYQVLTADSSTSSMSLNQVLLGVYNQDDYPHKNNTDPANLKYADANFGRFGTNTVRSSWNSRIGKDVSELNLGPAYHRGDMIHDNDYGVNVPGAPFKNEWRYNSADDLFPVNIVDKSLGYSPDNPFSVVSSFESFFNGQMFKKIVAWTAADQSETALKAYREKQEMWFRRWFSDSRNASPEVYYRAPNTSSSIEKAAPLHRFNLGKINGAPEDPWYSRFSHYKLSEDRRTFKNNTNKVDAGTNKLITYGVLDELMADSADFLPSDTEVPSSVVSGIPYFRTMIDTTSNIAGSFSGVQFFRQQIAANLNDYCDSDSIPTSDVSAANWNGGNSVTMPYFTGNEKTPYINEFILGLKLDNFTPSPTSLTFDVTPRFFTELIDIYGNASEKYNVKTWLNNLSFEIAVSAKGTVTFKDESTTEEFDYIDAELVALEAEEPAALVSETSQLANKDSAQEADKMFNHGYLVFVNEFAAHKKSRKFTLPNSDKIKEVLKDKEKEIASYTFTSFKVTVKRVNFDLTAVGLFSTDGENSGYGVDFVRGMDLTESNLPPVTIRAENSVSIEIERESKKPSVTPLAADWDTVYLTGMEVRDPRQNLNFTHGLTNQSGRNFLTDRSDWKCVPKLQAKLDTVSAAGGIGSVEINNEGFFTGRRNSCSNPRAPFTADDPFNSSGAGVVGRNYDSEGTTIADPAWLGNAKNQHMSTAYIRNAPMKSLWELGAIHRAAAWRTINLKGAAGAGGNRYNLADAKYAAINNNSGLAYEDGDAGLLNQVKLTPKAYSSGKLNVNMFLNQHPDSVIRQWDQNIIKALFYNLALGQQLSELDDADSVTNPSGVDNLNPPTTNLVAWSDIDDGVIEAIRRKPDDALPVYDNQFASRADFIEGVDDSNVTDRKVLANGFGIIDYSQWRQLPDAEQEEIIGKTANLLVAYPTQTVVYALVIVQTIKSVNAPDGTMIHRPTYKNDGTLLNDPALETKAITGKEFDITHFEDKDVSGNKKRHKYVYFDEITGELRALVTIRILNDPKRLQLYNIQYY